MARCLALALLAAAALCSAFVAPSTPRAVPRVALQASQEFQETEQHNIPVAVFAVLAGLMVSLAVPQSSWAGTGGGRPDFQVVRPGYMQGIDAANAAFKPGEIDYVTRSRIEAAQFPKAAKEVDMTRAKLQKAPTKEERVAAQMKQLEEFNKSATTQKASN